MYSAALSDIRAAFFMLLQASSITSALCACDAMSEAPAYEQPTQVMNMHIFSAPLSPPRSIILHPKHYVQLPFLERHRGSQLLLAERARDTTLLHVVLRAYLMS